MIVYTSYAKIMVLVSMRLKVILAIVQLVMRVIWNWLLTIENAFIVNDM